MLGLLQISLNDFIVSVYGLDTWQNVLQEAGYEGELPVFEASCPYHDEVMYSLIGASAVVLGISQHELTVAFGCHFVKEVMQLGYDKLLMCMGSNLLEFLNSLNNLHLYLSMGVPQFVAPEFRVHQLSENSLELHYFSSRQGLGGVVEGIITTMAHDYFDLDLVFEHIRGREKGDCDHEVFKLTYTPMDGTRARRIEPEKAPEPSDAPSYEMDSDTFQYLFPFHFILDTKCNLIQSGKGLRRLYPNLLQGTFIGDVFKLQFPRVTWEFNKLVNYKHSCFTFLARNGLELKGQFVRTTMPHLPQQPLAPGTAACAAQGAVNSPGGLEGQRREVVLFMGGPRLADLEQLMRFGMYISDFPPYDMSVDFLLLAEQRKMESTFKERYLRENAELKSAAHQLKEQRSRLKQSLDEALALRDRHHANGGPLGIDIDSPAEKVLKLLDKILHGEEVSVSELLDARDAIVRAGKDLRQPVNFSQQMLNAAGDSEVNHALVNLLTARRSFLIEDVSESDEEMIDYVPSEMNLAGDANEDDDDDDGDVVNDVRVCGFDEDEEAAVEGTIALKPGLKGTRVSSSGALPACPVAAQSGSNELASQGANQSSHGIMAKLKGAIKSMTASSHNGHPGTVMTANNNTNSSSSSTTAANGSSNAASNSSRQLRSQPASFHLRAPNVLSTAAAPASNRISPRCPHSMEPPLAGSAEPQDTNNVTMVSFTMLDAAFKDRGGIGGVQSSSGNGTIQSSSSSGGAGGTLLMQGSMQELLPSQAAVNALFVPTTTRRSNRRSLEFPGPQSRLSDVSSLQMTAASATGLALPAPMMRASGSIMGLALTAPDDNPRQTETTAFKADQGGARRSTVSGSGAPIDLMMQLARSPTDEIMQVLAKVDNWQFDSFELERVSNGRPLSMLGFMLLRRADTLGRLPLDEQKLARFLMRIEEGYPNNPYHCRTHAADVLRTLHVIMVRGGLIKHTAMMHTHTSSHASGRRPSDVGASRPSPLHQPSSDADAAGAAATNQGGCANWGPLDSHTAVGLLAVYLAAIVHDFDHRGVNNDFLIRNNDPLALLYNDQSPMENHHVSAAWSLLRQDQYNFTKKVPPKARDAMRKVVIDLVLATDMKQHFGHVSLFNSKLASAASASFSAAEPPATPSGVNGKAPVPGRTGRASIDLARVMHTVPGRTSVDMRQQNLLRDSSFTRHSPNGSNHDNRSAPRGSANCLTNDMDEETRMLVLKMALKCADLGHLASPPTTHRQWVQRLEEEMFRQGDREKSGGLPASPLMDRDKGGVTKSQIGFFNIVALPLFQSFCQVFPSCQPMLAAVKANFQLWADETGVSAPSTGSQ